MATTDRTAEAKLPGAPLTLAGVTYMLAAVPLVKMSAVKPLLDGGDFLKDPAVAQALVDALYFGLRRNHPDITRDMVEDNLDPTNILEATEAFRAANQLRKKAEESVQGEAPQAS